MLLAQRCGQKAEDRQREDGEEGTAGEGEVPAVLWNYNPDRGDIIRYKTSFVDD